MTDDQGGNFHVTMVMSNLVVHALLTVHLTFVLATAFGALEHGLFVSASALVHLLC